MPFVEDEARARLAPARHFILRACRGSCLALPSVACRLLRREQGRGLIERCLAHDERVIGDHDFRAPGLPDRALDEAFAEMGTGGIDAFAAPVGQRLRAAPRPRPGWIRETLRQPGRKIAAHHVAIPAGAGPARDKADGDDGAPSRGGSAVGKLGKVEEAQIVLPPLPDHGLLGLLGRVGIEPRQFLVELALQVLGVGRKPDRALVALRPETCRRDIAERLADTGAGLGDDDIGLPARLARREGVRGFGGGLAVLLLAQVTLGVLNVVLALPLWVAVLHNAGAALLLFTLVALLARLRAPEGRD